MQNLRIHDNFTSARIIEEIETEYDSWRKVDATSNVLVFKHAEWLREAPSTSEPHLLELVYNEQSNASFIGKRAWLNCSIEHLKPLVNDGSSSSRLDSSHDELKTDAMHLHNWQICQWQDKFQCLPTSEGFAFDVDTGELSCYTL